MNKVILMGRLTRDPEMRYSPSANGEQLAIARFSIAVDKRFNRKSQDGSDATADFFNCTAFGRQAEFVERYLKQGSKILVVGRIENDNYTNKNGERVYSVRVIAEEIEFAESKKAAEENQGGNYNAPGYNSAPKDASADGFMNIPEGIENDLPFK
ncbi:MAG: single-stranded DNA-binding protein [Eubacterium sp.]|nr:single-stranded DNA-binding protein [Eubacterium sp.]